MAGRKKVYRFRPDHDPRFGVPSASSYKNGCRCQECNDMQCEDQREWYRRHGRSPAVGKTKAGVRQPGRSCYVSVKGGCGHPECIEANREYQRRYMYLWHKGIGWSDPMDDL